MATPLLPEGFVPATVEQQYAYLGLTPPVPAVPPATPLEQARAYVPPGYRPTLPASAPTTQDDPAAVLVDPVRGAPIGTAPGANADFTERYARAAAAKSLLDKQAGVGTVLAPEAKPAEEKPKKLSPEAFRLPSEVAPVAPAAAPAQGVGAGTVLLPQLAGGTELKDFREGEKKVQQGLAEQAAVGAAQAAQEAGYHEQVARQQQEQATRLQAQEDFRKTRESETMAKFSAISDSLLTPSGQVDNERWWKTRTTGQKVAAFLSAFATGFAGTPNVVEKLVDADIASQRDALDRAERQKVRALDAQGKIVDLVRQSGVDSTQAENFIAALKAQSLESQFKAKAATMRPGELRAQLEQAAGLQQQKYAEAMQQMRLRSNQESVAAFARLEKATADRTTAIAGALVNAGNLTPEQGKRAIVLAPGRVVLGFSEDAAKKANARLSAGRGVVSLLDQAIAMRQEYGSETLSTDAKATMKTLGKQLLFAMNQAEDLGTLDEGGTTQLNEMIGGDLTAFALLLPKLRQLRSTYLSKMDDAVLTATGASTPGTDNKAATLDKPAAR